MKKLFQVCAVLLVMLTLFVSPGYCTLNKWGGADTYKLLKKVVPGYIQSAGTAIASSTSLTSGETTISVSYAYVQKAITDNTGYTTGTMADGTKGQLLTIFITEVEGSGTFTLTPTTRTAFDSITFDALHEYCTFLYLDDTLGWIVIATNATITYD